MGTILNEVKKSGEKVYRAEVRRQGKRITKRFPTRVLAKAWIQRTEVEIVHGEFIPQLKRHTLGQAIDRYLSEILPNKRAGTQTLHRAQLLWFKERARSVAIMVR